MSIVDNYRSSMDYREILRILQKSTSLQENFLWQTSAQGRNVIPVQHYEIDFVTREIVIFFDTRRFKLDPKLSLYVKLEYRTTVFKVTAFSVSPDSLQFAFPKEIKTLELRDSPRVQLRDDKEYSVALRPSLLGGRDAGNELHVRVFDISHSGLGLLVSEQNRAFLKNNRILWITALGEHRLSFPVLGEVVYINSDTGPKPQERRQKDLKVGVKLSGILPTDVFDTFIQ